MIAVGLCCAGTLALALAFGGWIAGRSGASRVPSQTGAPAAVVGTRVGNRAPDFSIRVVGGQTIRLADFRGKQALVITSLATWCTSCFYEAEQLAVVYPEFRDHVAFLSVSIDPNEDRLAIESFRVNMQTPWNYALASESGTAALIRSFGLFRFDITYVIDRDGIIQYVDHGPTQAEILRRVLAAI